MPLRHAHWYLLAMFPLAGLAFWQGYLAQIGSASFEFHAHGITATLWLMLLIAQSWTIQRGNRALHRAFGTASLVLFPLFLAGGVGIFLGMARRFVDGTSPFHAMYAPKLAWLDVVSVAAVAYLYFEGLRQRRKVHPHARFLLATAIFLLPPILGRLSPILPGLSVAGPQDFWKLGIGFQLANAVTAAIAFGLAMASGKHGRPFFIAGLLTLLGAVLFQTIGGMAWWERLFAQVALLPTAPFTIVAALAGAGIAWAGWVAGRGRVSPVAAATA
jgi:hypothetical protein